MCGGAEKGEGSFNFRVSESCFRVLLTEMCLLRGETRKFSVKYKMYSSGFIFNATIVIYIVVVLLVSLQTR